MYLQNQTGTMIVFSQKGTISVPYKDTTFYCRGKYYPGPEPDDAPGILYAALPGGQELEIGKSSMKALKFVLKDMANHFTCGETCIYDLESEINEAEKLFSSKESEKEGDLQPII
jgi:hypothetical protein